MIKCQFNIRLFVCCYLSTDCHLYPAKGNLAAYITEGNTGNTTMSCPPGTQFSMELCGCGLHVMDTPGNGKAYFRSSRLD